jgi:hypothetical protein
VQIAIVGTLVNNLEKILWKSARKAAGCKQVFHSRIRDNTAHFTPFMLILPIFD